MQLEVPCLHLDRSQVIKLEKETWEISLTGVQNLSPCNQEETDTRNMCYCIVEDKPTVVADILILMGHVFSSYLPDHDWILQPKKNQFVNVSKIHGYICNAVAMTLPAMFVLTGCRTVCYVYPKSKKAILERVLKQEILADELLSDFEEYTHLLETLEEKLKRFS